MARNESFPAIVLRSREQGESNRLITLFSASSGILDVFLFGGPKSKLRSLAAPYHCGRAWVYYDPVRDSRKLSDFDPSDTYPGIREKLKSSMHAALWAELLIRSRAGAGDFEHAFVLLLACLSGLDKLEEEDCAYASYVFLWRYAGLLGSRPQMQSCGICAGHIREDRVEYYSIGQASFLCPDCGAEEGIRLINIGPGLRRYLERIADLEPSQALRLRLDSEGRRACQALVFALAKEMAQGSLNALDMGEGLL